MTSSMISFFLVFISVVYKKKRCFTVINFTTSQAAVMTVNYLYHTILTTEFHNRVLSFHCNECRNTAFTYEKYTTLKLNFQLTFAQSGVFPLI